MMSAARYFFLGAIFLTGCHTAEKVGVATFHVIDAPAKYIRDRVDHNETTTTTTTTATTGASDVATPGHPVTASPPKTAQTQTTTQRQTTSTDSTSRPTKSSSASSTTTTQFPTAKPVPGKPGYVYSIDPQGGIVDVTGYKSGDKAKDPYTKQIFIVP